MKNEFLSTVTEAPQAPDTRESPATMTVIEAAPRGQRAVEDSPEFPAPNEFDTSIFKPNRRKQVRKIGAGGVAALATLGAVLSPAHELPDKSHDSTVSVEVSELARALETPYELQAHVLHGNGDRYAYDLSPELIETNLSPEEKAVFITKAKEILSIVEDNSRTTVRGGNTIIIEPESTKGEHTHATVEYDAATQELAIHAHVLLDESGPVDDKVVAPGIYNTVQIVLRLGEGNSLRWLTDELTIHDAREAIEKGSSEVDLVSVFGQYPDLDANDGVQKSYQMLIQPSTENPGGFQVGTWDKTYVNRVIDFEDEASVPRVMQLTGLAMEQLSQYDN